MGTRLLAVGAPQKHHDRCGSTVTFSCIGKCAIIRLIFKYFRAIPRHSIKFEIAMLYHTNTFQYREARLSKNESPSVHYSGMDSLILCTKDGKLTYLLSAYYLAHDFCSWVSPWGVSWPNAPKVAQIHVWTIPLNLEPRNPVLWFQGYASRTVWISPVRCSTCFWPMSKLLSWFNCVVFYFQPTRPTPPSPVISSFYVFMGKCNTIMINDISVPVRHQWPLLLTWFNFNPSMDK